MTAEGPVKAKIARGLVLVSTLAEIATATGCLPPPTPLAPESTPTKPEPTGTKPPVESESATIPEPTALFTPTPELSSEFSKKEEIDGLETYGDQDPLTQDELSLLITELNSRERAMRADTYYSTFFITDKAYDQFPIDEKESFQNFLRRQITEMSRMLKDGQPPVKGGVEVRRLIIVKEGVSCPGSYDLSYLEERNRINDSDGTYFIPDLWTEYFDNEKDGFFKPSNTIVLPAPRPPYYNSEEGLHYGLIHELLHQITHFPEPYALSYFDYRPSLAIDENAVELQDVPPQWKYYDIIKGRNDLGNTIMTNANSRLGPYESWFFYRREMAGDTHNLEKTMREATWSAPNDIPECSIISFGKDYADSQVFVYRTTGNDNERSINSTPLVIARLDSAGSFIIGNPFKEFTYLDRRGGGILACEGTLLIKVYKNGVVHVRWMDVRDFNLAYWRGHESTVKMEMNIASEADDPQAFDWTIKYEDQ